MSNRRRLQNPNSSRAAITQWAASSDGADIPGGCDTCDAYQTVHVIDHGLINVRIHHDDWCPVLPAMEEHQ